MPKAAISPHTRRIILTGSVFAATVSGALYGAYLKMDQDAKQDAKKYQVATRQEKIDALLVAREGLVTKRTTLEKQISHLEERIERKNSDNVGAATEGRGRYG